MGLCAYCNAATTIDNSHVVPRFVGKFIKANSPFGYMLNLWQKKPQLDLHTGPYLCATCDNEVFSAWESHFSQKVWTDPINKNAAWNDEKSTKFLLSLAYRYTLHFLATSPILANRPYSEFMRDLTGNALKDTSLVGKTLYLYPYVYRPILQDCNFLPGINHFLNFAVDGATLPQEGDLPNAMIVVIPKLLILICDKDLSASKDCTMRNPTALKSGDPFDPLTANDDMPVFLKTILNRWIGKGQAHQKELGRWKTLAYGTDKHLNPQKLCYVANAHDKSLLGWQRDNCRG